MSCLFCCFKTVSLCGFRDCIMNMIAFRPPEQRKYELEPDRQDHIKGPLYKMRLRDNKGNKYLAESLEGLEYCVLWLSTKTRKQIPALFIENKNCRSGFCILYSHGNSTDLGRMFKPLHELAQALNVHVFAYEFNGYGPTRGNVGEYEVIFGICAAYEFLTQRLGFKWNNIILYGRSIGSGPSIYLASHPNYRVSGVILHSPIASGLRIFKFDMKKTDNRDLFPNCDYIEHVKAHVFIMHGEADTEVTIDHGKLLASKCKNVFSPWWVADGNHNDIDYTHKKAYFVRVSKFLRYVRDFNLDKSEEELNEFYRIEPWYHTSKHIYTKNTPKIEESYKKFLIKNPKKSLRDFSFVSNGSLSSHRSLKDNILSNPKDEEYKEIEEDKDDHEVKKKTLYMPPRVPSKSFSFRPKVKTVEIEFNSCSVSSRGNELELVEDGNRSPGQRNKTDDTMKNNLMPNPGYTSDLNTQGQRESSQGPQEALPQTTV